jgi:phage I-like protein
MKNSKHIFIGTANELKPVNNVLKIPFGSYEHPLGLQIFGAPEARSCVDAFNERRTIDGFKGVPIYIGHPDVKSFQDKYRDHAAYGWIVGMAANESAGRLDLQVQWTDPGTELITNEAFAYFSPLWLSVRRAGNIHPFAVKSVGLTQEPNIQYLAVACEELAEEETPNEGAAMDLEKLRAWISKHWKHETPLEDAANELVVEEALALLESHEAELAAANEAVPDTATATLAQVQTELEAANEGLSAMRKAHGALLLDTALADGRITPATRAKWEERFAADGTSFDAVANELAGIDPVMKTRSKTKDKQPGDALAKTFGDLTQATIALANESNMKYDDAYRTCKNQEQFAHLFISEQA